MTPCVCPQSHRSWALVVRQCLKLGCEDPHCSRVVVEGVRPEDGLLLHTVVPRTCFRGWRVGGAGQVCCLGLEDFRHYSCTVEEVQQTDKQAPLAESAFVCAWVSSRTVQVCDAVRTYLQQQHNISRSSAGRQWRSRRRWQAGRLRVWGPASCVCACCFHYSVIFHPRKDLTPSERSCCISLCVSAAE